MTTLITKLASRKLWLFLILTAVMITLNYLGKVESGDLTNFLTFGLGIYTAGNVTAKFTGEGK